MKAETRSFNTSKTQTVQDAIAFGEYLLELNPNYDQFFLNFLRTQDPLALLNSEEVQINWINELINDPEYTDRLA